MKGLTQDEITRLLSKPEKTRNSKGKVIDASVRTIEVWFSLCHKLFDEETQATAKCSNPNCADPRPHKAAVVAVINGQNMCRYCFLDGYGLTITGQQKL